MCDCDKKAMVVFTKKSPYFIVDLPEVLDELGNKIDVSKVNTFCRCGESKNQPYCDGSHVKIGFVGEKKKGHLKNRVRDFVGEEIVIHDNRSFCCHDGSCFKMSPNVFRKHERLWIDPNADTVENIIRTIEACPSGALSYSIGGKRYKNLKRSAKIIIEENGPLRLEGYVKIKNDMGTVPESEEHCTLCRCGKSKNIPFCDGSHLDKSKTTLD